MEALRYITNLEHDLYTIIDYQSSKQDLLTDENELSTSGFLYCCGGSKFSSPSRAHTTPKV